MISKIKALLVAVALIIGGTAHAAELVEISGTVLYDEAPVCTMVLANGEYMFSCDPDGEYGLEVPLDDNGEITLFAFCDGLAPFKQILTPEEAADFTINMGSALPGDPTMTVTHELTPAGEADLRTMSGTVMYGDIPLCAMVLANGEYMFSCDPDGEYALVVPLDGDGQITLFGFVDGFAPFKEIVDGEIECTLEVTDYVPFPQAWICVPLISATFRSTCGADIDLSSIEMFVNDSLVAHTIIGSGSEVTATYTPTVRLEEDFYHTVTVRAQDVNGVTEAFEWEFYIAQVY